MPYAFLHSPDASGGRRVGCRSASGLPVARGCTRVGGQDCPGKRPGRPTGWRPRSVERTQAVAHVVSAAERESHGRGCHHHAGRWTQFAVDGSRRVQRSAMAERARRGRLCAQVPAGPREGLYVHDRGARAGRCAEGIRGGALARGGVGCGPGARGRDGLLGGRGSGGAGGLAMGDGRCAAGVSGVNLPGDSQGS